MLSGKFRLRKKEEVDLVFHKGKSVSLPEFTFKFLPNAFGTTRIAVLVGKKLSNKASARNRIRRRLREVARLNLEQLPQGLDLLIIARSLKLREIDFAELTGKFLKLASKLPHR
ncbi:MAG: ribonuclease P protein component [Patescibacteria group bacterium]